MRAINEDEAELLIEEHLQAQGWHLTDCTPTRKRWRERLDGEEVDCVFLYEVKVVAIIETKKSGKHLWSSRDQAQCYFRTYKKNTGHDILRFFASDGRTYLRQNLKANTVPEYISNFPTPAEVGELFRPQATELHGTLREYQRIAVSQALGSVQAGRGRLYVQMATATGKTITAAGVIAKLWSIGLVRRALFLVDRDSLAEQTKNRFKTYLGDNFTVERATGSREDRYVDVPVTPVQHLAARNKYVQFPADHFSLVILDECPYSYFRDLTPRVCSLSSVASWSSSSKFRP